MRIAFFIGHMGHGGAERVISILANEYADKGWDVDILMLLAEDVKHKLHPRVRTISLVGDSHSYLKNAFTWLKRIRKYARVEKPDRIVSFIGRINALVLTATLGMKVPVIVSERNDPKHDGRGKVMLWYCNQIYHRAKAIVFQNKYEQSCFSESLKSKGIVIPNPVHVTITKSNGGTGFVVATAGRLNPQKNHFMLIDAMAIVHKKHPKAKCRIYGDGKLQEELQTYINEKNLTEVVTLEGNHTDIHEKLAVCSVFAMTSEFEGLSNALIEAMMIGMPCISTDYPGADELINDGVNGLLVKCGDATALASVINKIINGEIDAAQLAQQGSEDAKKFKKDHVLSLWNQVIEE